MDLQSLPSSLEFDEFKLAALDASTVPKHLAVIMDGNRRWSEARNESTISGYRQGAEALIRVTLAAQALGVETLTAYCFSTENWKRLQKEISSVFSLMEYYIARQSGNLVKKGIHLSAIGDLSGLSPRLQKLLSDSHAQTAAGANFNLVFALNYGGRDEIKRATARIATACSNGTLKPEDISEELISSYLDTAPWGDPDLLIRSGGIQRLSNFLLWQASYSELYITEHLWPELGPNDVLEALLDYQSRERKRGQ